MHSKSDFGPFQISALKAFLDAPERAPESMGYAEATGFLFCVACAPQMVPPSQWLPVIIDPDNAVETSLDTKQAVMNGLIALYNEMTRQVQQEDIGLPPGCEFADDPIDNLQPGASMSQWANGFREAYLWLEQMWSDYVPQDLKEEFGYQLTVLCFFCNRQMATDLYDGVDKTQDITFEGMAAQMKRLFPDAMRGVAALGMSIQEVLDQRNAAEQQPVTRGSKVGRNDPCSCGSGVKYKKCCGAPNA